MNTSITVFIVELAGNHAKDFLSEKYGSDLQSAVFDSISTEYPDMSISVVVETRDRNSGVTPEPVITVDGDDECEILKEVQILVENECRIFGEQCMQDEEYFV